jgi:Glycosyltransferase family 87
MINKEFLSKVFNIILIVAIVLNLLVFLKDVRNTTKSGLIDLRNRVVAARVLIRGEDPYYFKWKPGMDERLIDPHDKPHVPVTRATIPPTVILLHTILGDIPYLYQKYIWLILQWGAFVGALFALTRNNLTDVRSKFLLISGLLFVGLNHFLRLHIERGQIYIIYTFLLAISYWILQGKMQFREIIAGTLIGFTISLRPPILILGLAMILFKKFKLLIATGLSCCFFLLASIVLAGMPTWMSYFSSMNTIADLTGNILRIPGGSSNENYYPTVIEGMNNLTVMLDFRTDTVSIRESIDNLFNFTLSTNQLIMLLALALLGYSFLILFAQKIAQKKMDETLSLDLVFIVGMLMIQICEFFIPAPRYAYNTVQLLIPLILVLKNTNFLDYRSTSMGIVLMILVLMTGGMLTQISSETVIGEFCVTVLMIVMSILFARGGGVKKAS